MVALISIVVLTPGRALAGTLKDLCPTATPEAVVELRYAGKHANVWPCRVEEYSFEVVRQWGQVETAAGTKVKPEFHKDLGLVDGCTFLAFRRGQEFALAAISVGPDSWGPLLYGYPTISTAVLVPALLAGPGQCQDRLACSRGQCPEDSCQASTGRPNWTSWSALVFLAASLVSLLRLARGRTRSTT